MAGFFITFEGGEGAGKSTQIQLLRDRLTANGIEVLVTREPGGSPRAEEIRTFLLAGQAQSHGPLAETILFAAARLDHLEQTIRPALAAGRTVLCDRFADSTRAYQGADHRVAPNVLAAIEDVTLDGTAPDLTLILDLPAETGLARAHKRRGQGEATDRFEGEALSFHTALREAFLAIALTEPRRCAVIDATKTPDEVSADIWTIVGDRLPHLVKAREAHVHGA